MRLHILLEQLIQTAQKPKTDFAISMNMTPSGLSKMLSGKRLPSPRERKFFTNQAAEYFSEAIYSHQCHVKLTPFFPVIYVFQSRDELFSFFSTRWNMRWIRVTWGRTA